MPLPSRPVWFITGCSTGFGRELARLTAERGWPTVVTARDASRVADLAEGHPDVLPLALDVTDAKQVAAAVQAATKRFGRIDVLVNNAGYGYQSSIEEADEKEIRAQFEANVFGLFAMTRAVLPGMRERRAGHVINVTSVAGLIGFPGSGFYASSKHAVEGFSDALVAEVAPIGIHVTCVEPGPFRTDWAGRSLKQTPSRLPEYADTVAARMNSTSENSGKQAGDPVGAAEAIIRLTQENEPPKRILLGKWGHDIVLKTMKERLAEIERLRDASLGADHAS